MWVRRKSELVEGEKQCWEAVGAIMRFVRGKRWRRERSCGLSGGKCGGGSDAEVCQGKIWRRERS